MYFSPQIHKRLDNVPDRAFMFNCNASVEKVLEFLDQHLKSLMQSAKSYVKDASDFLRKIEELGKVPHGAILVTDDVQFCPEYTICRRPGWIIIKTRNISE